MRLVYSDVSQGGLSGLRAHNLVVTVRKEVRLNLEQYIAGAKGVSKTVSSLDMQLVAIRSRS